MNPISQLLNRPSISNQPKEASTSLAPQPKSTGSLIHDFINFAKNYKGNPEEDLKNMLNSGKVTQAEYEDAYKKAERIMPIIERLIKPKG